MALNMELEHLLAVRPTQTGPPGKTEVLIHWQGLPSCEDTGEETELVQQRFPAFHLKDKVCLWQAGNVMNLSGQAQVQGEQAQGKEGLITYKRDKYR